MKFNAFLALKVVLLGISTCFDQSDVSDQIESGFVYSGIANPPEWQDYQYCSGQSYAIGFQLKSEPLDRNSRKCNPHVKMVIY